MDSTSRGSNIAKNGFINENDVVTKFNNWKNDKDAKQWLTIMKYRLSDIEYVRAVKISGYKSDVQVQVTIKLTEAIDVQNIQVKLVSMNVGFNQIDKRKVDSYTRLWDIPVNIVSILKRYTGEIKPNIEFPRDKRRMFADEFLAVEIKQLLLWLNENKSLIISDIMKGRGSFAAEWMLVAQKIATNARWVLKPMNFSMNYFGNGEIKITDRGNIKIGRITMQRKGGDGGRDTAKMLQFKINPAELFDL